MKALISRKRKFTAECEKLPYYIVPSSQNTEFMTYRAVCDAGESRKKTQHNVLWDKCEQLLQLRRRPPPHADTPARRPAWPSCHPRTHKLTYIHTYIHTHTHTYTHTHIHTHTYTHTHTHTRTRTSPVSLASAACRVPARERPAGRPGGPRLTRGPVPARVLLHLWAHTSMGAAHPGAHAAHIQGAGETHEPQRCQGRAAGHQGQS